MFYILFIDECKICMEDGKIVEIVFVLCGYLIVCMKYKVYLYKMYELKFNFIMFKLFCLV